MHQILMKNYHQHKEEYIPNTSTNNGKMLPTNHHFLTISITIRTDYAIWFGTLITICSLLNQEESELRISNTKVKRTICNQLVGFN